MPHCLVDLGVHKSSLDVCFNENSCRVKLVSDTTTRAASCVMHLSCFCIFSFSFGSCGDITSNKAESTTCQKKGVEP